MHSPCEKLSQNTSVKIKGHCDRQCAPTPEEVTTSVGRRGPLISMRVMMCLCLYRKRKRCVCKCIKALLFYILFCNLFFYSTRSSELGGLDLESLLSLHSLGGRLKLSPSLPA